MINHPSTGAGFRNHHPQYQAQIYPTPSSGAGMAPAGHRRQRRAREPRGLPVSAPAMGNPRGRKMEVWFPGKSSKP